MSNRINNVGLLVASYDFNGAKNPATGKLRDGSGHGNDITIVGSSKFVTDSHGKQVVQCSDGFEKLQALGKSTDGLTLPDKLGLTMDAKITERPFLKFNPTDNTNVVNIADADRSLDKTYAVLVRFPDAALLSDGSPSDGMLLGGSAIPPYVNDNMAIRYGSSSIWWRGGGSVSTTQGLMGFNTGLYGTWSWVILRRNSTTHEFYLDTRLDIKNIDSDAGVINTPSTAVTIGKGTFGGGPNGSSAMEFAGVYEWNRVLTDVETRALVDNDLIPSDFVKGYSMEEGCGDTLFDLAVDSNGDPKHNDGAIVGAEWINPSEELIKNGGFDNGDHWTIVGDTSFIGNGMLTLNDPSDYVRQDIDNLVDKVMYTIAYTVKTVRVVGGLFLSGTGFAPSTLIPSTVGRHSVDLRCDDITAPLKFIVQNNSPTDIDIDNVSVKRTAGVDLVSNNALRGCLIQELECGDGIASWAVIGGAERISGIADPDGGTDAFAIRYDGTETNGRFYQGSRTLKKFHCFVNQGTMPDSRVTIFPTGSINLFCAFDLVTGTVATEASGCTATIEEVGGGWFKCIVELDVVALNEYVIVAAYGPYILDDNSVGDLLIYSPHSWAGEHMQQVPALVDKTESVTGVEIVNKGYVLNRTECSIQQTDPALLAYDNKWVLDGEFVSIPVQDLLDHDSADNVYPRTKELEDGQVVITDIITESNTGEATSMTTDLHFDPNSFSIVGKINTKDNYTVEDRPIFEKIDGSDYFIRIALVGHQNKTLSFTGMAAGVVYGLTYSSVAINDGQEHMFMCTYDGTTWSIYVDGEFTDSITDSVVLGTASNGCNIGSDANNKFDGTINSLDVYNIPLSLSEFKTIIRTKKSTPRYSPPSVLALTSDGEFDFADTDVVPTTTLIWEVKGKFNTNEDYNDMGCLQASPYLARFGFGIHSGEFIFAYGAAPFLSDGTPIDNNIHMFKICGSGECYIDNRLIITGEGLLPNNGVTDSIHLFARNWTDKRPADFTMLESKMWDNGVLIRHYVPRPDGTLFELVNRKVVSNGAGKPFGVTRIPYLNDPSMVFSTRDGITNLAGTGAIVNHGAIVGNGIVSNNSTHPYIEVDIGESLNGKDYTMSAMFKVGSFDTTQSIINKSGSGYIPSEGIATTTVGRLTGRHIDASETPTYVNATSPTDILKVDVIHLVHSTYNASTRMHRQYVDGVLVKETSMQFDMASAGTIWTIGANAGTGTPASGMDGKVYWAEIRTEAKSADWVKLNYEQEALFL